MQDADGEGASELDLLRRHAAGDSEAFGELFRRHRDRLWAVALRTVCDPEEAADALQDALVSAFRRGGAFRGDSAVTTWLHRIVVNASLDRLRRRAARPAVAGGDEEALEALAPHDADPARATDTRLDVEAALRILPPQQRAALVLVDMLGYSVDAAAAILEVSPGTVKSRCARARDPSRERERLTCAGRRSMSEPAGSGNGHLTHPDSDVLAEFRAGLVTGRRGKQVAAHLAVCDRCTALDRQLAEVGSLLAAAPPPVLPDRLAERLDTVLAAELARRDEAERAGARQSGHPVQAPRPAGDSRQ